MKHPDDRFTAAELAASLERLGVREIEERMELSPLLSDAGIGDTDGCNCSCRCDVTPQEEPQIPENIDALLPTPVLPRVPDVGYYA